MNEIESLLRAYLEKTCGVFRVGPRIVSKIQ